MEKGLSIHIGLNVIDEAVYGTNGQLYGCVNDANAMEQLAIDLGYTPTKLLNEHATADAVAGAISDAASQLVSGDILMLTYAGHGSQVPDANGEEQDAKDETWVLYDRELVDDELFSLWEQFSEGVRIIVISDSCHSGTMLRMMRSPDGTDEYQLEEGRKIKEYRELEKFMRGCEDPGVRELFGRPRDVQQQVRYRFLPRSAQERSIRAHGGYRIAQLIAGPTSRAKIGASVILISGCQDSQLSSDGSGGNGLFTSKLLNTWDDGNFTGDYRSFHSEIRSDMPAIQVPNYMTVGVPNPDFEAQKPFTIAFGNSKPSPVNADTPDVEDSDVSSPDSDDISSDPSVTSTDKVLKIGDEGPEVKYLQRLLRDTWGYRSLVVDGDFGRRTRSAVRNFQREHSLTVDGIVGRKTWKALRSRDSESASDRVEDVLVECAE